MTKYYVLVKKKSSKKWLGAIPSKNNVSKVRLQKAVRNQAKKGFVMKVVSALSLKRYLNKKSVRRRKRK